MRQEGSNEHRQELLLLRLLFIVGLLLLWEAAVKILQIPAFLLPAPSSVGMALYRGTVSGLYEEHVAVTLTETALGFIVGSLGGLLLGTCVALSRRFDYFISPIIVMFQAMPKVALAPLIIVWFGLGITSKVVNSGLVCFFPLMINTIVGLRSADEDRISLMRSLAASPLQIFAMLRVPNALPYIFAGLEIAMIFALIGAIVGEFVGATAGLGMLIQSMNLHHGRRGSVFRSADPFGGGVGAEYLYLPDPQTCAVLGSGQPASRYRPT